ncbi:MAG: hypothetical protein ABW220_07955 [Burkholderiaceae bacterium]
MSTTLTVQLDDNVKLRLDRLAALTQRSDAVLAAEAIGEFVSHQEWQVAEIRTALLEADRGAFANEEDVEALATKWRGHAG